MSTEEFILRKNLASLKSSIMKLEYALNIVTNEKPADAQGYSPPSRYPSDLEEMIRQDRGLLP